MKNRTLWVPAAVSSMTLLTCATDAAAESDFPIAPGETCMTASCHSDMATQQFVHLVASEGHMCAVCHRTKEEGTHNFTFAAQGGALCTQCHGNKTDKEYKHVPVEVGLCTFCHDPHQSGQPKQLKYPLTSLCTVCHNQPAITGGRVAHLPAEDGQCTLCHDPHTSDFPKQLKRPVPELCFGCHDKPQKDEDGKLLPAVKPFFDDKQLNQHPSFARGECLVCHDPHASEHYRLEKGPYPKSIYASFSTDKYFCFYCHDQRAFTEPRSIHETKFRNGDLNLHYRHVNREKGRSCRACHHHHASHREALITERVPFGDRFIEIREFEKTATGGKCGPTCHRTMLYDRYLPVSNALKVTPREGIAATPEQLREAPQPPTGGMELFARKCAGCHGPDASGKVGPAISGVSAEDVSMAIQGEPMMKGLASLSTGNLEAIAEFLSTAGAAENPSQPFAEHGGETLYKTNCAGCHGPDASGLLGPAITGASTEDISGAIKRVAMMQGLTSLGSTDIRAIADFLLGGTESQQ